VGVAAQTGHDPLSTVAPLGGCGVLARQGTPLVNLGRIPRLGDGLDPARAQGASDREELDEHERGLGSVASRSGSV
jgi:hypothetical protein